MLKNVLFFFFLNFQKGPAKKRDDKGSVRSPAAEIVFQRHLRSEDVCLRSFRTSPSESKVEEVPTRVLTEKRRKFHCWDDNSPTISAWLTQKFEVNAI